MARYAFYEVPEIIGHTKIKLLTPSTDVGSGKSLIPCTLESDIFTPFLSNT